ncbi:hypothetical protein KAR02_05620, partial [Candidatus Bipolaricaulota bacterium]|nr:hypothetical protein [Candidatus Bipolaricaulota bacterium]
REGNALAVLRADTSARNDINGLSWSPDGRSLAAAGQNSVVHVWDIKTGEVVHELRIGYGSYWTRGVAYSPSGDFIATSGSDYTIRIWDAHSGEVLATLRGHRSPTWAVAWAPDESRLASGSGIYQGAGGDTTVRIWGLP